MQHSLNTKPRAALPPRPRNKTLWVSNILGHTECQNVASWVSLVVGCGGWSLNLASQCALDPYPFPVLLGSTIIPRGIVRLHPLLFEVEHPLFLREIN